MQYFVKIHTGATSDTAVQEFSGNDAAKADVVAFAARMLAELDGKFWNAPELEVVAWDEQGRTIMRLAIAGSIRDLDGLLSSQA
ncbi:hypothetical protein SAMN05216548_111114 [Faunimonas pinastri]|uniref:DUF6894 domain-containing protein n=1 Tax=Faunimonas pinastri TaxID=1855383 RepID=A0A1H9LK66_9HYPH|nr:hypothetical protein [Faunimonas pinastri]SER11505.1 hypothetical protein SAMN05216548_111114 [Faunimonas pinastri]